MDIIAFIIQLLNWVNHISPSVAELLQMTRRVFSELSFFQCLLIVNGDWWLRIPFYIYSRWNPHTGEGGGKRNDISIGNS
jgi:hypothetical protein